MDPWAFGDGESAPFGGMLAAIDALQTPAGTAVPGSRVRRPATAYRPCLMLAAILQANGRSAIKHILNIDHLPGRGILIAPQGKVQAPRPAPCLADTEFSPLGYDLASAPLELRLAWWQVV